MLEKLIRNLATYLWYNLRLRLWLLFFFGKLRRFSNGSSRLWTRLWRSTKVVVPVSVQGLRRTKKGQKAFKSEDKDEIYNLISHLSILIFCFAVVTIMESILVPVALRNFRLRRYFSWPLLKRFVLKHRKNLVRPLLGICRK